MKTQLACTAQGSWLSRWLEPLQVNTECKHLHSIAVKVGGCRRWEEGEPVGCASPSGLWGQAAPLNVDDILSALPGPSIIVEGRWATHRGSEWPYRPLNHQGTSTRWEHLISQLHAPSGCSPSVDSGTKVGAWGWGRSGDCLLSLEFPLSERTVENVVAILGKMSLLTCTSVIHRYGVPLILAV